MPRIWDSTGDTPKCPTCGSIDARYLQCDYGADELYECRTCGQLFDHFDPRHT